MSAVQLEAGVSAACRDICLWSSIWRSAHAHGDSREPIRHLAYIGGWKKLEPLRDWAIRSGQVHRFMPLLEAVLDRSAAPAKAAPAPLRPRRLRLDRIPRPVR